MAVKIINKQIVDDIDIQQVKSEIEDRFGKIDDNMLIYMYEEWFEKQAKELGIDKSQKVDNNDAPDLSEH